MSEWKNNPVDCSLMGLLDGLWRYCPVDISQCPAILTDFGGDTQWVSANALLT